MSRRPRDSGERGFTLLEILVALAILGLILAAYTGSLRLMLGAVARQATTTDATDARDSTARALRRLLEGLQPGGKPPMIEAGPHRLRFVTRLPGRDDPIDATIARDGDRLVLLWTPRRHVRPLAPPPRPELTELASGIAALNLSYFDGTGWVTALPPENLPVLIRLRLVPVTGLPGPDLVVAPRLIASP